MFNIQKTRIKNMQSILISGCKGKYFILIRRFANFFGLLDS
jgi:hypothetical protein